MYTNILVLASWYKNLNNSDRQASDQIWSGKAAFDVIPKNNDITEHIII